ncbi:tol-pal system YbgF family protein [Chitinophaga sp. HK235]|uniref:tetratricopeptide repeat protein n=1 Tax=Chitinophaga sp. HK235 TaxID=2952571 RepID=UPI001BADD674|nr:hypothetical protein [Chitinophaga sp. HK235]
MVTKKNAKTAVLPDELANILHDLLRDAEGLRESDVQLAANTTAAAWALVPEPKFDNKYTYLVLSNHIPYLLSAGRLHEAHNLAGQWAADVEGSGEPIRETKPYILLGASLLYLQKTAQAKTIFRMARRYGVRMHEFQGMPRFYRAIADGKLNDEVVIQQYFQQEVIQAERTRHATTSAEITTDITRQIEALNTKGHEAYDERNYAKAARIWIQALDLIPSPQEYFSDSGWLNTAIGDACFMLKKYQEALQYLLAAKSNIVENGSLNAFTMLRLGQIMLETGEEHEAREYLMRAHLLGGTKIFEKEDARYLELVKHQLELKSQSTSH